jgi:hypothetical protein
MLALTRTAPISLLSWDRHRRFEPECAALGSTATYEPGRVEVAACVEEGAGVELDSGVEVAAGVEFEAGVEVDSDVEVAVGEELASEVAAGVTEPTGHRRMPG